MGGGENALGWVGQDVTVSCLQSGGTGLTTPLVAKICLIWCVARRGRYAVYPGAVVSHRPQRSAALVTGSDNTLICRRCCRLPLRVNVISCSVSTKTNLIKINSHVRCMRIYYRWAGKVADTLGKEDEINWVRLLESQTLLQLFFKKSTSFSSYCYIKILPNKWLDVWIYKR